MWIIVIVLIVLVLSHRSVPAPSPSPAPSPVAMPSPAPGPIVGIPTVPTVDEPIGPGDAGPGNADQTDPIAPAAVTSETTFASAIGLSHPVTFVVGVGAPGNLKKITIPAYTSPLGLANILSRAIGAGPVTGYLSGAIAIPDTPSTAMR